MQSGMFAVDTELVWILMLGKNNTPGLQLSSEAGTELSGGRVYGPSETSSCPPGCLLSLMPL